MDRERIVYFADPTFPKALAERLAQRGYQLDAVRRGDDLLQRAFAERISLIIAFAEMPGISGLALCGDVKQNAGLKDIPVLVFSARKGGDRQAYYSAGCEGYYEAPFDEVNVTQRIDELLMDRSTARKVSLARLSIDYKLNTDVARLAPLELQDSTLFLYARSPLDVGTRMKFTLSLLSKTVLDAYGEVVKVEAYRAGATTQPAGMWVRFYEMDDGSRRIFEGLTRQRTLQGAQWEEVAVETIVDKIALDMSSPATHGPVDPVLVRAGFDRAKVPAWEEAAFSAADDGTGEVDLLADMSVEAAASLREAAGTLHKLQYHLSRYADFFYLGPIAARKVAAHSEQVLARAEASADVLASLIERLASDELLTAANPKLGEHLTFAQEDLLERMVRLRTVMTDSQRPAEHTTPTTSDGELCPTQELRYRCMGLVELFDFSSTGGRKEYARTLPAELDLSELSAFDVLCFIEGKQPATALHPDLGAWGRALVARELELAEFLHGRRPVKESRPERAEEVVKFAQAKLGALGEVQEHFCRDLARLAGVRSLPRLQLAELASTHRRLLRLAAQLSCYYNLQAPAGAVDYNPKLASAAQLAESIVAPVEGPGPLVFPSLGEAPTLTSSASGSTPGKAPDAKAAGPKTPRRNPLRFFKVHPAGKWILLGVGVLAVGASALGVWLSMRGPGEGVFDASAYRSIVPVASCVIAKSAGGEQLNSLTLRCIVEKAWPKEPLPARKKSARDFARSLAERGVKVDNIVLVDVNEKELAVGSGDAIEVFDN